MRPGIALPMVLLVIVALELLAISTLALATHEGAALGAHERMVQERRETESALNRLVHAWPLPAIDSLAVSQTTTLIDHGVTISVRRSTWGQYHATAFGAVPAHRAHMLLQTIDLPRALAEADQAIVTRAPVSAHSARFLVDATPCPTPPLVSPDTGLLTAPAYAFAGLSWRELASIADTGFVFVEGPTSIPAGLYSGVLVVSGDLTLKTGADIAGLIVLGGHLTVEDGVRMTGSIIQRGSGGVAVGSADLTFSRCAVTRALTQTPAARRLVRSGRRFIPVF